MKRSVLFILFLPFLLHQCAQVHPPSGGPKDKTPPQVVRAVPANGAVNFDGKGFVLHFDEYIRTSRIQQELIVSPRIEPPPKVTVEGKELIVEWEDMLQEGRTYSFRFGNSVRDITESNRTDNLVYAFSTGPHLDSLHYQGRVVDARTMKGLEGVLTMLYRDLGDSVPMKKRPFYFARTGKKGYFDIPYLAGGEYKFFSLKDQNRNQRFDLPDEAIGFVKEPVRPYSADSSGGALIRLFTEESDEQFIESRRIRPGYARFLLKKGAKTVSLTLPDNEAIPWEHSKLHREGSDTVSYWFPDRKMPDSVDMALKVDGEVLDTFMVRNGSELWGRDEPLSLQKAFQDPLERNEAAAFSSVHPLQKLDAGAILGVSDSDTVALAPSIGGPAHRRLILKNREAFLEDGLKLTLYPGALVDTFGREVKDTLNYSFEVREEDEYGKLELLVKTEEQKRVILSLLDGSGKTIRRRVDSTGQSMNFPYLQPGPYRIELILDRVPNGKWDPGEYPERQPEPVIFYPDTVKVRSNWEKKVEWKGIGG